MTNIIEAPNAPTKTPPTLREAWRAARKAYLAVLADDDATWTDRADAYADEETACHAMLKAEADGMKAAGYVRKNQGWERAPHTPGAL